MSSTDLPGGDGTGPGDAGGARPWTVARYLATRLEQLGIRHLFGVPGNHLGPFLTEMQETTSVRWVGTPTECGAGFAADAYARVRVSDRTDDDDMPGIGAVACTYSVGAFNLLNPVGGAYVEYVPLIAINACPTYEQWLNFQAVGLLTSHMSQRRESNLEVFRQVTVDAQALSNPGLAASQIDCAITACLAERRPVYLEVMEDVWMAPCEPPQGTLVRRRRPLTAKNREMLDKALDATVALMQRLGRPILWAGEEVDRFRLHDEFTSLVTATEIPFCTTVGAKSVVSENTRHFVGVYNGKASDPRVREVFASAGCRIGLGTWATSKNLGGEQSVGDDWVMAAREGVSVGPRYFPDVQLSQFIPALRDRLVKEFGTAPFAADYFADAHREGSAVPESTAAFRASLSAPVEQEELSYDTFFRRISSFLEEQETGSGDQATCPFTLVSDAAFSLLGSMNVHVAEHGGFLAQNSWLSIGYSVGAAAGVGLGRPDRRPMVFVGDGSFQETCQELSTQARHRIPSVVFVLDNEGFYGIEQMLVSPGFYRKPPTVPDDFYNVLHPWRYDRLAEVFGSEDAPMTGVELTTHSQLNALLARIADPADPVNRGPLLVRVRLSRTDYPSALGYKLKPRPKPREEQPAAQP